MKNEVCVNGFADTLEAFKRTFLVSPWPGISISSDIHYRANARIFCIQPYYGIYSFVAGYLENVHRGQDRVVAVHCVEPLHPPVISGR